MAEAHPSSVPIAGFRTLIVEDEYFIADEIEEMVAELGGVVEGAVSTLEAALEAVRVTDFDVVLLDVNLGKLTSLPVARLLTERGVPFILTTGYNRSDLDPELQSFEILTKPFATLHLRRALQKVLGGGGAADTP